MTENLLETSLGQLPASDGSTKSRAAANRSGSRPAGLADKFWDDKTGQVRLDALIKSYNELERKLSTLGGRDVPPGPEHYQIKLENDLLSTDPEVNRQLHTAGFGQDQVQLVYDLAGSKLMPIAELASMFEAENQIGRLRQHFGGEERWREVARQVDAWGRSHLPARVFEALATTYEGVVAMQSMMSGNEPGLMRQRQNADPTEASLKQLMRD